MVDLRAQYPVLERTAYLNAGTDGPLARAAADAARTELESELTDGRTATHFARRFELLGDLRAAYATVLGAQVEDVAIATSTSEGLGVVLDGMGLGPGDEIVTSDSEHPGLIGPLKAARDAGVAIRMVPLADVADAVSATTSLVACSHVSWITGEFAPAALAEVDCPVVLDGAQGAGAVPVDVGALGCAAYAAAGQKWLCGADGTGMLWLDPEFAAGLRVAAPSYLSFADASQGLDGALHGDARRFDTPSLAREVVALSLAATQLLLAAGLDDVLARAAELASAFADGLAGTGRTVAPRDATTLVAFEDPDPEATRDRLAAAGVLLRNLPGTSYLRASVGAWNDESDLERLLAAL